MITSASPGGRIARQTFMSLLGVLLAAVFSKTSVGVATSGTMLIYCGLLDLYTTTKEQATVLVRKRIMLQFLAIPTAVLVHFILYSIPVLRPLRWCRIFLAEAICVPLLLGINHRRKLGLSEIGLLVSPVLIAMTFDNAPTFFVTRLVYTTVAILVSFFLTTHVITIRYDKSYEEKAGRLREMIVPLMESAGNAVSSALLKEAKEQQREVQHDLGILRSEAFSRKKLAHWQERLPLLLWEQECDSALFHLLDTLSAGPDNREDLSGVMENCFRFHREMTRILQSGEEPEVMPELPVMPAGIYAMANTEEELHLLHAVSCYYSALRKCPVLFASEGRE